MGKCIFALLPRFPDERGTFCRGFGLWLCYSIAPGGKETAARDLNANI